MNFFFKILIDINYNIINAFLNAISYYLFYVLILLLLFSYVPVTSV